MFNLKLQFKISFLIMDIILKQDLTDLTTTMVLEIINIVLGG